MPIAQVNKLGLIIFAVLCIKVNALAVIDSSEYIPFPDSNAVWAMECCQGFQCQESIWYEHYWVGNEDTTIGGKDYHKLFRYLQDSGIVDEYVGAYRNDTILRHVYYVRSPDTTEILLYDFSLEIGDTFRIPYPKFLCNFDTNAVLAWMDSVLIGSVYRRRFVFNTVRIDEGIGSRAGLFEYYASCFEYQCILKCFKSGDSITLGNPGSCNLATNGVKERGLSKIEVQIHPNPLTYNSILKLEDNISARSVTIYNILAEKVASYNVAGKSQLLFNRRDFERGWYTFVVTCNDNKIRYGKFTVE